MKIFDEIKVLGMIRSMGYLGGAAILISYLPVWHPLRLSDLCTVQASGQIVPTAVANGTLAHFDGTYFIQQPYSNATLLSRCGKGGCSPLYPGLFQGHVGSQVQAEFCGQRIARVAVAGVEVYRLSQEVLDRDAQVGKKSIALTGATFMGLSCLVSLLLLARQRATA